MMSLETLSQGFRVLLITNAAGNSPRTGDVRGGSNSAVLVCDWSKCVEREAFPRYTVAQGYKDISEAIKSNVSSSMKLRFSLSPIKHCFKKPAITAGVR